MNDADRLREILDYRLRSAISHLDHALDTTAGTPVGKDIAAGIADISDALSVLHGREIRR